MSFIIQGEKEAKYLSVVVALAIIGIAGAGLILCRQYLNYLNKKSFEDIVLQEQQQAQQSFTCGVSMVAGAGGLTYGTVIGPDDKCWLDRNLGATQVATASDDSASYGYYYQWGRPTDGHQVSNSATTSKNSDSDTPGHANFITDKDVWRPYDWRVPQSPKADTLWAGANGGSNNPCPIGWHVPTQPEWATVAGSFSPQTSIGALNSILKLPLAGSRYRVDGVLGSQGSYGNYWSGSPSDTYALGLFFDSGGVDPAIEYSRAFGFSVRCVKD